MIVKFLTPPSLGGLGMRKDTPLKGIVEGKCTQAVPNGPVYIAGAGLYRESSGEMQMPPPRESGARVSNPEGQLRDRERGRCSDGLFWRPQHGGFRLFLLRSKEPAKKTLGRSPGGNSIMEPWDKVSVVGIVWLLVAGFP